MADFCKQCSEKLFGEDFGDMREISTEEQSNNGEFAVVICEGCGPCQVDHTGRCVSPGCLENHGNLDKKELVL